MNNKSHNSAKNDSQIQALLRHLPKVDVCIASLLSDSEIAGLPVSLFKENTRLVLNELRNRVLSGKLSDPEILSLPQVTLEIKKQVLQANRPCFKRVINATGVIVHTNLGRSLLPDESMTMLLEAGRRYSNLEFNLANGQRGSRYSLVEDLLCELTGAEAALVVNNNAAAVLIALETLAKEREVIVSRGQLVEIGGSFRIPDVMARSGAKLVEVGATNRTHLRDYENNINEETALLLKVHCSNYRIIGFSKEVSNEELVALGKKHNLPVMEDLGSGCLVDLSKFGLMKEPTVREVVASGVDIVTFSGDKLLGGPQAGIILGNKEFVEKIKKNPLNRALRIDKFTLSGLESVLRLYRDEQLAFEKIPTLAMIAAPVQEVDRRAKRLVRRIQKDLQEKCQVRVLDTFSRVGGGAMPEQNLASRAVALRPCDISMNTLVIALRESEVPIIPRIEEDNLLLDMRTVANDEVSIIAEILLQIFATDH